MRPIFLRFLSVLAMIALLIFGCSMNFQDKDDAPKTPEELQQQVEKIELPEGFEISVYAADVPNARSMYLSEEGTLFVGTRTRGYVYALRDTDGDYKVDEQYVLAKGLDMPNGVTMKDGDLYLAENSRISRFPDIENNLENPRRETVYDNYPTDEHHGWKFIDFGPDGKLYVPVGAPCNICLSDDPVYASITRMDSDGTNMEIVQRGIRNTVGFTWHPESGELWFTDNGRDWMGDDRPPDELNHAPRDSMHFGYPFCHGGDLPDPEYGDQRSCDEFIPPAQKLGPHVAALGLTFYTGDQFPGAYKNQIFIAEHGSWNRSTPIGYRVMLVTLDGDRAISYEPFASGWLQDGKAWGRPVDVELLPDGSVLVSDDFSGTIYRISHTGD